MLLELIRYALPSSSWNVVWSPVLPLTMPGKLVCTLLNVKVPLGVSLVAKYRPPPPCATSTYFRVAA